MHEQLKSRILHLELMPGTLLDETEISRQFGVSRSPVREALIRLVMASDGVSLGDLVEVLEVAREAVACGVVQRGVGGGRRNLPPRSLT